MRQAVSIYLYKCNCKTTENSTESGSYAQTRWVQHCATTRYVTNIDILREAVILKIKRLPGKQHAVLERHLSAPPAFHFMMTKR